MWDGLRAAVIPFKMAACPAWALCTVVQIVMVSFHLDLSDIACIDFFFFYLVETITDTKAFLSVLFHKRPPLMVLLASWWDDGDVFLQSNIFKRWWSLGELLETLLLQNNVLITCNFGKLVSVSLWSTPDGEKSEKWEKNQGKVL